MKVSSPSLEVVDLRFEGDLVRGTKVSGFLFAFSCAIKEQVFDANMPVRECRPGHFCFSAERVDYESVVECYNAGFSGESTVSLLPPINTPFIGSKPLDHNTPTTEVLLHEIAYHLANSDPPHEPVFVATFCDLAATVMGPEVAYVLRVVHSKQGVR